MDGRSGPGIARLGAVDIGKVWPGRRGMTRLVRVRHCAVCPLWAWLGWAGPLWYCIHGLGIPGFGGVGHGRRVAARLGLSSTASCGEAGLGWAGEAGWLKALRGSPRRVWARQAG
jgi:hypothetical protein